MPDPIRLLIVDDHFMVREGLKYSLAVHDDVEVVGQASDGAEAIAACEALRPDVILMDALMPVLDGVAATEEIHRRWPATGIVILTSYVDDEMAEQALAAGAVGYVLKDASPERLVQAIRDAGEGRGTVDGAVAQALMDRRRETASRSTSPLTRRETEVLALLADGLSNKQIAVRLGLSPGTVRIHVSNVLAKLGASNRTAAVMTATRRGLV